MHRLIVPNFFTTQTSSPSGRTSPRGGVVGVKKIRNYFDSNVSHVTCLSILLEKNFYKPL